MDRLLDADGRGLVQTSTDTLRGRKLFLWGAGRGGRRWQQWLTEPGTGGYAEIQAGLARTQLEHVPLDAGGEFTWLEAYGPLAADPATVHGADWGAAREEAAARLQAALPRADVDAAYEAWLPCADQEPKESLATGSGWGALESARAGLDLPGTPFSAATLGAEQEPWLTLLRTGELPAERPVPGAALVAPAWRDLLESARSGPATDYHLGLAQWHAGDRAQAVRSWERALGHGAGALPLYCLAVAESVAGETGRAADRYREACDEAARAAAEGGPPAGDWRPVLPALAREAVPALLAAGRTDEAADLLADLPWADPADGRFRLLTAQVLLAQGGRPRPGRSSTPASRSPCCGRATRCSPTPGTRSPSGWSPATGRSPSRSAPGPGRSIRSRSGTTTGCGRCSRRSRGRYPARGCTGPAGATGAARGHPSGLSSTALLWLKVSKEYSPW